MSKKFFLCVFYVFLVLGLSALFLFSTGKEAVKATQLLQPSDLVYKGAFRLPQGVSGSEVKTWAWGGFAMTYYPNGDPGGANDGYPGSIYGAGHAWEHQVSEISIPIPVIFASKNLNQLNTASTLQSFRDIYNVSSVEMPRTGLEYLPKQGSQTTDKLYFCWGAHLDVINLTHGWCELTLSNPQIKRSWYLACNHNEYNTNDYLFEIPGTWAGSNTPGKLLATGRYRDGGWSGQGPAIFAIGPWNQGNPPPSGTSLQYVTLLFYTSSADPESWDPSTNHTMTDYHHSDEWSGAAWITAGNKAAVVFVGTKGTGDCWYGDQNGPCLECAGERGWWSTGFVGQFIFYDPDDLAKVAAGTMESWEPQPYATLNVDQYLYHIESSQQWYHLGAACFDRTRGLFYVFEPYVDDDKPIVHVWKVKAGSTAPTITVTSPNGGQNWAAGSSQTITWSSTETVGNVKIEYSTNNGNSWSTIVASTSNDGTYSWTVPDVSSSQCLVRISETDGTPTDTSDSVFSITSGGTNGVISLDRTQLNFGAALPGTVSDSQTFSIGNSGSGTMNWSVTDDAGWLSCSPSSGTNSGIVTVSVDVSGLSAGEYSAAITVSSSNASNSPRTVDVTLNGYGPGGSGVPFGNYATPDNGSTVRSSVPFTGWALDDIGVESVKIYRGNQDGSSLVYIGDAVFVEGARPDVEQAYPDYPMNYRAGWGYMMLTNFLPNSGNGTFTIFAIAGDKEGHQVTLGAKAVTCDNANAVKPFGAIDTPAQGGTASGTAYRNWGWVLTPMPNAIPTDGFTISVIVDGVDLGHPIYNIYRAEIAGLFLGYANSSGAAAYFDFDTTAYENGVHIIAWHATDNAGNTDGIGSRYFSIQNSGASSVVSNQLLVVSGQWSVVNNELFRFPVDDSSPIEIIKGFNRNVIPQKYYIGDNGFINVEINELEHIELHVDDNSTQVEVNAEEKGSKNSKFKIQNSKFYSGYQLVGNQLRPFPIGSTMDTERGIFYWQLGPGFFGDYDFVFIRAQAGKIISKKIKVKINPRY